MIDTKEVVCIPINYNNQFILRYDTIDYNILKNPSDETYNKNKYLYNLKQNGYIYSNKPDINNIFNNKPLDNEQINKLNELLNIFDDNLTKPINNKLYEETYNYKIYGGVLTPENIENIKKILSLLIKINNKEDISSDIKTKINNIINEKNENLNNIINKNVILEDVKTSENDQLFMKLFIIINNIEKYNCDNLTNILTTITTDYTSINISTEINKYLIIFLDLIKKYFLKYFKIIFEYYKFIHNFDGIQKNKKSLIEYDNYFINTDDDEIILKYIGAAKNIKTDIEHINNFIDKNYTSINENLIYLLIIYNKYLYIKDQFKNIEPNIIKNIKQFFNINKFDLINFDYFNNNINKTNYRYFLMGPLDAEFKKQLKEKVLTNEELTKILNNLEDDNDLIIIITLLYNYYFNFKYNILDEYLNIDNLLLESINIEFINSINMVDKYYIYDNPILFLLKNNDCIENNFNNNIIFGLCKDENNRYDLNIQYHISCHSKSELKINTPYKDITNERHINISFNNPYLIKKDTNQLETFNIQIPIYIKPTLTNVLLNRIYGKYNLENNTTRINDCIIPHTKLSNISFEIKDRGIKGIYTAYSVLFDINNKQLTINDYINTTHNIKTYSFSNYILSNNHDKQNEKYRNFNMRSSKSDKKQENYSINIFIYLHVLCLILYSMYSNEYKTNDRKLINTIYTLESNLRTQYNIQKFVDKYYKDTTIHFYISKLEIPIYFNECRLNHNISILYLYSIINKDKSSYNLQIYSTSFNFYINKKIEHITGGQNIFLKDKYNYYLLKYSYIY